MIRSGKLKHKGIIQEFTDTQNSFGEIIQDWIEFAPAWASIEPIKGEEYWESQQVNAEITHRIEMRYISGIKSKMRFVSNGRIFDFISVINIEERNRKLQIMAKENVS